MRHAFQLLEIDWKLVIAAIALVVSIVVPVVIHLLKRKDVYSSDVINTLGSFSADIEQLSVDLLRHQQDSRSTQKQLQASREKLAERLRTLSLRREQIIVSLPHQHQNQCKTLHLEWRVSLMADTGIIMSKNAAWASSQVTDFEAAYQKYCVWLTRLKGDIAKGKVALV